MSHAACAVFGRDEAGEADSQFCFKQPLIDTLLKKWSDIVRKQGLVGALFSPNADNVGVADLCISDR
jgi:hypothetical protein